MDYIMKMTTEKLKKFCLNKYYFLFVTCLYLNFKKKTRFILVQ